MVIEKLALKAIGAESGLTFSVPASAAAAGAAGNSRPTQLATTRHTSHRRKLRAALGALSILGLSMLAGRNVAAIYCEGRSCAVICCTAAGIRLERGCVHRPTERSSQATFLL